MAGAAPAGNIDPMTGAQRVAAELCLALGATDTSPRGVPLPGDSESWGFGVAAPWCNLRWRPAVTYCEEMMRAQTETSILPSLPYRT